MAENIYTAINKVMAEVGYVKKQRGQNLNYTYAGEAALIAALRPEMVEAGIVVFVDGVDNVETREYTTAKGSAMVNVTLTARIKFVHAPSGTEIVVVARGEGSDSGDKANNKAMTGAYKYALRQTFCIETGDDPDKERNERPSLQQRPPQPEPPKQNGNGKAQAEPPAASMTLETAQDVTNSKGEKYGDLTTDELSRMTIGIGKAMNKPDLTGEERETYQFKLDAVKMILAHRNGVTA